MLHFIFFTSCLCVGFLYASNKVTENTHVKKRKAQASVISSEYDIFATFLFAANNKCGSNVKILKSCLSFRQPRTTTQRTATELCASFSVTMGVSFGYKKCIIALRNCFRIPLKDNLTTFPASALCYSASTDLGEDKDNKEPVLKFLSRWIQKSYNKSTSCCTNSQEVHLWRQYVEESTSAGLHCKQDSHCWSQNPGSKWTGLSLTVMCLGVSNS